MSQVLRLTDRNFKEEVFQSQIPVLVEFSASWCVPSQQMKPMLEAVAKEYAGKLKFGNLNVDQNPRTASKYQIMGCPTFILLNSGKAISRRVGAQSKKQLLEMIHLAVDS
jgi:thioredoxin 1